MPRRLAGFAGRVARYARFAGFAGFALYCHPCCEALELESELLFEGLSCWHPNSMRLIASSWLMMLSGIQDGEGSGTGKSLAEMGGLLGCLLARREVNVEQVIVSIE